MRSIKLSQLHCPLCTIHCTDYINTKMRSDSTGSLSHQFKIMSAVALVVVLAGIIPQIACSPQPDLKETIMNKIYKIPEILKSSIPMPKSVAVSVHFNNHDDPQVVVPAARNLGDSDHHEEFLKSTSAEHNNLHHTNHILTMVLISVAIFLAGGFMVLALWFCYRKRKPTNVRTIYIPPNDTEMNMVGSYNNARDHELRALQLPNVQKMISTFNKK